MDLLDEVVMHSNVTSLLYLRIRDPELDCHECVASGLRQHSRRQLRKVSPSNSFFKNFPSVTIFKNFSSVTIFKNFPV
jgi:hypothetical protein